MTKEEIIAELRRVADLLKTDHLSQQQFRQEGRIAVSTVQNNFGSWNQAIAAAGLSPISQGPSVELWNPRYSEDELLEEIIRLTRELGKKTHGCYNELKGTF